MAFKTELATATSIITRDWGHEPTWFPEVGFIETHPIAGVRPEAELATEIGTDWNSFIAAMAEVDDKVAFLIKQIGSPSANSSRTISSHPVPIFRSGLEHGQSKPHVVELSVAQTTSHGSQPLANFALCKLRPNGGRTSYTMSADNSPDRRVFAGQDYTETGFPYSDTERSALSSLLARFANRVVEIQYVASL